jgi:CNT family concentrative nucleoside transporter
MDALILGALDGVKMAAGIAAVLVAILGCVELVNMLFSALAAFHNNENILLSFIGRLFKVVSINNIFGLLFLPLTFFTGVSLDMNELWMSSVLIGQRLLQTSVPPYIELGRLSCNGEISNRAMLIVSYVLCGFAHIPSIGIFVGGLSNLVPSRSGEISSIAWKAMWAATLATLMTGCVAGIFDFGSPDVIGQAVSSCKR